jgi:hypothetical protein
MNLNKNQSHERIRFSGQYFLHNFTKTDFSLFVRMIGEKSPGWEEKLLVPSKPVEN